MTKTKLDQKLVFKISIIKIAYHIINIKFNYR